MSAYQELIERNDITPKELIKLMREHIEDELRPYELEADTKQLIEDEQEAILIAEKIISDNPTNSEMLLIKHSNTRVQQIGYALYSSVFIDLATW